MRIPVRGLLLLSIGSLAGNLAGAQSPAQPGSETPLFRLKTDLVLVNLVALNGSSPSTYPLQPSDLRVLDNNKEVSLRTFEHGEGAGPLALWFLVQCNMQGWRDQGSGLFREGVAQIQPVLKTDAHFNVYGVAHWCDDGTSNLDLIPTADPDAALSRLSQVLSAPETDVSHGRYGELALQRVLASIVRQTAQLDRDRIPAVVFLYGDYSAMPRPEADRLVDQLLSSTIAVYGLRDERSPRFHSLGRFGGEQGSIAAYFAEQTGGTYETVQEDEYGSGLQRILDELHGRYELGFVPPRLDGRRHKIRINLSPAARMKYPSLKLRYRAGYLALPQDH